MLGLGGKAGSEPGIGVLQARGDRNCRVEGSTACADVAKCPGEEKQQGEAPPSTRSLSNCSYVYCYSTAQKISLAHLRGAQCCSSWPPFFLFFSMYIGFSKKQGSETL